jgi:hypothetical protein
MEFGWRERDEVAIEERSLVGDVTQAPKRCANGV